MRLTLVGTEEPRLEAGTPPVMIFRDCLTLQLRTDDGGYVRLCRFWSNLLSRQKWAVGSGATVKEWEHLNQDGCLQAYAVSSSGDI